MFTKHKVCSYIVIILLGVILFGIYLFYAFQINAIWEIPDEAGYLYNAAYFAGYTIWEDSQAALQDVYYGYGYSILLIPFFFVCDNGAELIRCTVIINSFLVLMTYLMQIRLLKKVLNIHEAILPSVVSFILCFYPYLMSSSMKVYCETFLVFQFVLISNLLQLAFSKGNVFYYLLLALATIYIFFIHTRAIVVVAAVTIILTYAFYCRKTNAKSFLCYISVLLIAGVLLYIVKNNLLDYRKNLSVTNIDIDVVNVLNAQFFLDRIKWMLGIDAIKKYFIVFVSKFFYLTVSTGGLFLFGLIELLNLFKANIKKNNNIKFMSCFFLFTIMGMLAACTIAGTGDTYAYMFYGRYYEYVIFPAVLIGMYYVINNVVSWKKMLWLLCMFIFSYICARSLTNYAAIETIGLDTNRISGMSYAISRTPIYLNTITIMKFFCFVLLGVYVVRRKQIKIFMVPIMVAGLFAINSDKCLNVITNVSVNCKSDIELCDIVNNNFNDNNIYFIIEPYIYEKYFTQIQVYIKNHQVSLIEPDDVENIKENSFIITFNNSEIATFFDPDSHIADSRHYRLFLK